MSRATTFLTVGLIILLSIYMQRFAATIMGPGSMLWELVYPLSWPVNGQVWAEEMYVAVSVWVPWIIRVAAIVGAAYLEFTKQNVTAQAAVGGQP